MSTYVVTLLAQTAVKGTLNVVRQAHASGIRHFSCVSSIVTFVEPGVPIYKRLARSTDWNLLTEEDAQKIQDDMVTYSVSKTLAEKALWKFAEENRDLNLVSGECLVRASCFGSDRVALLMSRFAVGPTTVIGPLTPEFLESTKPGDAQALSSSILLYNFLTGPPTTVGTLTFGYVDVRDVARALVAGIGPRVPGNHRLLIASIPWFDNVDILTHIATVRPELKDRLIRSESFGQRGFVADEEITKTVEVLGLGEVTHWKKTVEDSLDSMLKLERVWKEKGVDVDEVLGKNSSLIFWETLTVSRVELD